MNIIYDFGANDGSNIPYYLLKSDLVVAVEANPSLTRKIESRFAKEVQAGRLKVVACALSDRDGGPDIEFFVNRKSSAHSQILRPADNILEQFESIRTPGRTASSIISQFGAPFYVKIDVEHYDQAILKDLFENGIRPPFLSAESHSVGVFAELVANGHYNAFKLVRGGKGLDEYRNTRIQTGNGSIAYSFTGETAGPFGEDLHGGWQTADEFVFTLAYERLGWMDIHATNLPQPDGENQTHPTRMTIRQFLRMLRKSRKRY